MDKKKAEQARQAALDADKAHYNTFLREFEEKIAHGEPPEGVSRIQILEQLMHTLHADIKESNLKYVSELIESLDEDQIIDSKKENAPKEE